MEIHFIPIILGFIEGFALILSPCILPILPIVLAGSLTGSKKRPLGIITGFIISFAFIAFFSRSLVIATGVDLNTLRYLSFLMLTLIGLIMISSYLSGILNQVLRKFIRITPYRNSKKGFLSGIFIGFFVAMVWTPCAGPILAAIIVQTVLQKTTISSFFVLLAFALGAALPMLIIVFYGRALTGTFNVFKNNAVKFRKILGALIIASVLYMIYLEGGPVFSSTAQTTIKASTQLRNGLWLPYTAPEIENISNWINSPALKINQLRGHVILVDFWTYSCINCIRTLPYLKNWYNKYHKKGLIIIGVHSSEFDFEKDLNNVANAVRRNELLYPIALDNQFSTWSNYSNHYWPAHYLIDPKGQVVYQHFGEGDYDIMENNIRYLLGIDDLKSIPYYNSSFTYMLTPETYLGYARADKRLSPILIPNQIANYHFPQKLASNAWALQGQWEVKQDKIISKASDARLRIQFNASKIYLVMGNNTSQPIKVDLLLNNKSITTPRGQDVTSSSILVNKYSLYELVKNNQLEKGLLEIIVSQPGIELYTLTFGK